MSKEEFTEIKQKVVNGENPSEYLPVEYKVVILN